MVSTNSILQRAQSEEIFFIHCPNLSVFTCEHLWNIFGSEGAREPLNWEPEDLDGTMARKGWICLAALLVLAWNGRRCLVNGRLAHGLSRKSRVQKRLDEQSRKLDERKSSSMASDPRGLMESLKLMRPRIALRAFFWCCGLEFLSGAKTDVLRPQCTRVSFLHCIQMLKHASICLIMFPPLKRKGFNMFHYISTKKEIRAATPSFDRLSTAHLSSPTATATFQNQLWGQRAIWQVLQKLCSRATSSKMEDPKGWHVNLQCVRVAETTSRAIALRKFCPSGFWLASSGTCCWILSLKSSPSVVIWSWPENIHQIWEQVQRDLTAVSVQQWNGNN